MTNTTDAILDKHELSYDDVVILIGKNLLDQLLSKATYDFTDAISADLDCNNEYELSAFLGDCCTLDERYSIRLHSYVYQDRDDVDATDDLSNLNWIPNHFAASIENYLD